MANIINVEKKEKYELIIALVAIVISLSAFKEELKVINIDLGFYNFSLASYFLYLILIFILALNLYTFPIFLSSTFLSKFKIIRYFEITAYFLFAFAIISPTLLIATYLINYVIRAFPNDLVETVKLLKNITAVISFVLAVFYTIYVGYAHYQTNKQKALQELEDKTIKEFELAQRLFNDGYYSQSILESFKVIENYFKSILIDQKDINPRISNYDIVNLAEKNGLIRVEQKQMINQIKEMRNSAAHLNNEFTKEQAEYAIANVKELLK